jgi:aconitate hydratase
MGVLPLMFKGGQTRQSLGLTGDEAVTIEGIAENLTPRKELAATIVRADGSKEQIKLLCRIDTSDELEYYRNGGIMQYVIRQIMGTSKAAA